MKKRIYVENQMFQTISDILKLKYKLFDLWSNRNPDSKFSQQ